MLYEVWIPGRPVPQGSKSAFVPKDKRGRNLPFARPQMLESSKSLKPWRRHVARVAKANLPADWTPIDGDVNLAVEFVFERAKDHEGTGRNAGVLKDWARGLRPTTGSQGDLSKLVRAVEDSLTDAGVWTDDRLVVSFDGTRKRYAAPGEPAGAFVRIAHAEPATS